MLCSYLDWEVGCLYEIFHNSVGVTMGWTAGARFPAVDFSLLHSIRTGWAHPASYKIRTLGAVSPGVKWPGRDVDH
jgi:hypothetical protein